MEIKAISIDFDNCSKLDLLLFQLQVEITFLCMAVLIISYFKSRGRVPREERKRNGNEQVGWKGRGRGNEKRKVKGEIGPQQALKGRGSPPHRPIQI